MKKKILSAMLAFTLLFSNQSVALAVPSVSANSYEEKQEIEAGLAGESNQVVSANSFEERLETPSLTYRGEEEEQVSSIEAIEPEIKRAGNTSLPEM